MIERGRYRDMNRLTPDQHGVGFGRDSGRAPYSLLPETPVQIIDTGADAPVLISAYTWRYTVVLQKLVTEAGDFGSDDNGPSDVVAYNLREVGNTASFVHSIRRDPATLPPDLDVGFVVGTVWGRLVRAGDTGALRFLFSAENPVIGACAEPA